MCKCYCVVQYGPNEIPMRSLGVMSIVSLAFAFVGRLNTLGTILTIPFMLTYAVVDYAHFSLAMSDDQIRQRQARLSAASSPHRRHSNGGSVDGGDVIDDEVDDDLDRLFPAERRRRRVDGRSAERASTGEESKTSADGSYQLVSGNETTTFDSIQFIYLFLISHLNRTYIFNSFNLRLFC